MNFVNIFHLKTHLYLITPTHFTSLKIDDCRVQRLLQEKTRIRDLLQKLSS